MYKTIQGLFLVGASLLFSEQIQETPTVSEVADKNAYCDWQGKVGSASPCSGFFLDLSYLYLRSELDGLSYGQTFAVTPATATTPGSIISETKELDFDWDSGFNLGLGYIFPNREQWQLSGYWTYLHSDAENSASSDDISEEFIAPQWAHFSTGSAADRASADWTLNFNVMDIAISRNAFFGKWLSIEPRMGIRAAWINQDYNANYRGLFSFTTGGVATNLFKDTSFKADQEYWGVGTRMGTGLQWHLTDSFSISGGVFASLVYGGFTINETIVGGVIEDVGAGPALLEEVHKIRKEFNALRAALETEIGIRWQHFFQDRSSRLLIGLYYQFNNWFDQNEIFNPVFSNDSSAININSNRNDLAFNSIYSNGNLQMQGLRAQVRYDF
ncbi:MAG: Lpg1974 family pore-forming outer membrane protein [Candidatus Algichlamydia australiensis]|nr:Lpg1974 family pore-forming outer membrane protein [Chlamydiales bacterium]